MVKIMSLDDESTRSINMAGFRRFYNSPACSDIKFKLPYTKVGVLHAHKIILAMGSGYFLRKHEEGDAADWKVDVEDASVMEAAIRYMYGFEFLGENLDSLEAFAQLGAAAQKYEIAGLPELILTAASRVLDDCIRDEADLREFLYLESLILQDSGKGQLFSCAVKIIGDNITKLRKHAVFQELLREEPELAIALVNLLSERQSHMQEGS